MSDNGSSDDTLDQLTGIQDPRLDHPAQRGQPRRALQPGERPAARPWHL
ncbi:MAG: hypothetical protein MZW92_58785 [Comamonadaceae bacterium]|nr:hypothetical protein [Comamonadaceae bacterium]